MKLTASAKVLFSVAAGIPLMCREMGIAVDDQGVITFTKRPRPWLVPESPRERDVLKFDPDIFADRLGTASSGERHCILFLLNVWNPCYAKDMGWTFNLIDCIGTLDSENRAGIVEWIQSPIWP